MNDKIENSDEIVKHWLESSDQDYITMKHLIESKDFCWALFMSHLVIEKILKALYVKKNQKHAIFTHDLLRLASKIELELTLENQEILDSITTFNLNARYDDYKQEFSKLCSKEFTEEWIVKIEELRLWLINQL